MREIARVGLFGVRRPGSAAQNPGLGQGTTKERGSNDKVMGSDGEDVAVSQQEVQTCSSKLRRNYSLLTE